MSLSSDGIAWLGIQIQFEAGVVDWIRRWTMCRIESRLQRWRFLRVRTQAGALLWPGLELNRPFGPGNAVAIRFSRSRTFRAFEGERATTVRRRGRAAGGVE